ncbi:MAG: metallophosphoesterase family protein [Promethearchaeota archaeon]
MPNPHNENRKNILYSILIGMIIFLPSFYTNLQLINSKKSFHTEKDSLIFAACGDPHYVWTNKQFAGNIVEAWMKDENIPGINFAFNMGDLTHFGAPKEYATAMSASFGHLMLPYFFMFGNHDTANYKTNTGRSNIPSLAGLGDMNINPTPYDAITSAYNATGINSHNYAFLYDDILFLIFGDQGNTMLLTNEQREWLEYMTTKYHNYTTITFSHQGFYTELYSKDPYQYYNDFDWWKNFIQNNPQIVLHIHGHNHVIKHYQYFGLDTIDTGLTNGVGKPWTVLFQITNHSINVGVYDVIKRIWVNPNLFSKNVSTTFKHSGMEWYSFFRKVQDNQKLTFANRIVAKEYKVEVIGANPELVNQNEDFKFWDPPNPSWFQIPVEEVYWIGYYDDANNPIKNESVEFNGKDIFSTSIRPAMRYQPFLGWYTKWTEGKVPDSTTPLVFPQNKYVISSRFKANASSSNALDIYAEVYSKNLTEPIWKTPVVLNSEVDTDWKWINGTITIPDLDNAWILRVIWQTKTDNTLYLDRWSVKLWNSTDSISSFRVNMNQATNLSYSGSPLKIGESQDFVITPTLIDNFNTFKFEINGSKTALFRFIYKNPLLWSDDLTFGIKKKVSESEYILRLDGLSVCGDSTGYSITPFGLKNLESNISAYLQNYTIKSSYNSWALNKETISNLNGFPLDASMKITPLD